MNQYVILMAQLLESAFIVNFEYWSEFIVRIQRDETTKNASLEMRFGPLRIPPLFCLRLRGKWWLGDKRNWDRSIQAFPMKGIPPMPPEAPLQASTLMMELDSQIIAVRVNEKSDLTLVLSDGRPMTVQGQGGEWEESWLLELPVDDPDRDSWSIICDSQGIISGRVPNPMNL